MPAILVPFSQSPSGGNEMIGRGVIMFDPLDPITGLRSGALRHLGNIEKLEISDKVEVKEKYESMDPEGLLYARAVVRQTVILKITGDEMTADNFAAAINGVVTRETVAGAAAAGEALGPTAGLVGGQYYQLAQKNVDPASLVLSSGALGTDYALTDPVGGVIYVIPGGALAGATGVTITTIRACEEGTKVTRPARSTGSRTITRALSSRECASPTLSTTRPKRSASCARSLKRAHARRRFSDEHS